MDTHLSDPTDNISEQKNEEHQIIETVENIDKGKAVSSRPNRTKYVVWNKNDGGSDNLTPIERLIYFLLANGGRNLDLYIGNQEENKVVGRTRAAVIQNCVDYFKGRGIKVTASSVRSKINNILETGPEEQIETNESNTLATKNTEKTSKEEYEAKLRLVCPRFSMIKEMLDSEEANIPFFVNNNQPTMSVINPQDLITNEEENIVDDTRNTDYYITDEDNNNNNNNNNNNGYNRSNDIVGYRQILPNPASSSNNRKRHISNVEVTIHSEAKKNKKKEEAESKLAYRKKLDLCQMQVNAYIKYIKKRTVSDEERIRTIKDIQDHYFKDEDR